MADTEEREIISQEEFAEQRAKLIESLDMIAPYIILSEKQNGISIAQMAESLGATEEELIGDGSLSKVVDIRTGSLEELDKRIPEEYRPFFTEIISLYEELKVQGINLQEFFESPELAELFKRLVEIRDRDALEFAQKLSNSDLSAIPPEMYVDLPMLSEINFEGTGAHIDFSILNYSQKIIGSLKGCDIIAFEPQRYARQKTEKRGVEALKEEVVSKDVIDPEQYQIIVDGYRKKGYVPSEVFFLFESKEMQDNNEWFFEERFADVEGSSYMFSDIWKILTPENQKKYKYVLDAIIDRANDTDDYTLHKLLRSTDPSLIDEYDDRIRDIYKKPDGTKDTEKFIQRTFGMYPAQVQINKFYDIVEDYEKGLDKDTKHPHEAAISVVWEALSKEAQEGLFKELYDKCKLEDGKINVPLFRAIMSGKNEEIELPEDVLQTLVESYRNGDIKTSETYVWTKLTKENQKSSILTILKDQIKNGARIEDMYTLWNITNVSVREELLDKVSSALAEESPELSNKIKNQGYIDLINSFPREKRDQKIEADIARFLGAMWGKYDEEGVKAPEDLVDKYNADFAKILCVLDKKGTLDKTNYGLIIKNLPRLGYDVIDRTYNSNSEMIRSYSNELIASFAQLPKAEVDEALRKIEDVFSRDSIPSFVKIYKYFEIVISKRFIDENGIKGDSKTAPALRNAGDDKTAKKIIFADLMKIAMDSNNKTLLKFIDVLETGNKAYIKLSKNNFDESILSTEERKQLQEFLNTAYFMYEESDASKVDEKEGKKLVLTGNLEKDAKTMGTRYSHDGKIEDLSDRVFKGYLGAYHEIFGDIDSIGKIKEYMQAKVKEASDRNKKFAEEIMRTGKVPLKNGDLVKGIGLSKGFRVFTSIVEDGIRAGELLGVDNHSDATPLDTDFGMLGKVTEDMTLRDMIASTPANGYGSLYAIIRNEPDKIEVSRKNSALEMETDEDSLAKRLEGRRDPEVMKRKITGRTTGNYTGPRVEVFNSDALGEKHYGIRTGVGLLNVDAFATTSYDERFAYEIAMSGIYVPIINPATHEVMFTPERFEELRSQMQGLSYYHTGDFVVDASAHTKETDEIVQKLFPDGNVEESISEKDARRKRMAIQTKVEKALAEEMGLRLENRITGDLTNGFVEFIDTGSTGRGTNLPGAGDFDFSMKVDRNIISDPKRMGKLKAALRKVLGKKSKDPESSLDEFGGNFRYKKVSVEGIEDPLDIDITFMGKDERVSYSTDMCVRDRLDGLKKSDPEGYKYTIANIVLAKKMLKERGLYKKTNSDGATPYGGFGGVGVETWILQNGGSFVKAMETFLEAADKSTSFEEFKRNYQIFDYGQNHMAKKYPHDSFIQGISSSGFTEMRRAFAEIRKTLVPEEKKVEEKPEEKGTVLSDTMMDGMKEVASQSRSGRVVETSRQLVETAKEKSELSQEDKEQK